MNTALAIVQLLNAAAPGVAEIILLIKKQDGTISVGVLLDEADAQFDANMQQIKDWQAAHPQPKG
jgi:hypothetical protein